MTIKELTSRIDWDRIIAIQQFMTAAYFLPNVFGILAGILEGTTRYGVGTLSFVCLLAVLNLLSGWQLLNKNDLGYVLSCFNACAQILTVNFPALGFSYHGPIWTEIGIIGQVASGTKFDFNVYFDNAALHFALGRIGVNQLVGIDLVAFVATVYLYNKTRVVSK